MRIYLTTASGEAARAAKVALYEGSLEDLKPALEDGSAPPLMIVDPRTGEWIDADVYPYNCPEYRP
jgi:hypothetical protein